MQITAAIFSTLFLLGWAVVCQAQGSVPADAEAMLEKGVQAFQSGDPKQARHYLLEARASGLESNALTYNLGVVNYRLARYDAAAREFRALLGTSHRDLARYNLGLIALATDNLTDAHDIFLALSMESGNEKIRGLSARQLERLSDTPPAGEREAGRYPVGLVMVGAGYDSNVDQLPDNTASGLGEGYSDVMFSLGSGSASTGNDWIWNGLGYHQRFPGNPESNLSLLEGDLGWQTRVAATDLQAMMFTRHWWLDTGLVESYYGVQGVIRQQGCGPLDHCYARLELAAVSGGSDYPEYDGGQYDLEAGFYQRQWGGRLGVELQLGLADRDNIRDPGYAASVSPFRQGLELSWRTALAETLALTLKGAYRHSDYDDDYQWQTSGGTVSEKRQDERWSGGILMDWQLARDWFVTSEWSYESNDSSLDGYDYDRYNLWVGVGKTF